MLCIAQRMSFRSMSDSLIRISRERPTQCFAAGYQGADNLARSASDCFVSNDTDVHCRVSRNWNIISSCKASFFDSCHSCLFALISSHSRNAISVNSMGPFAESSESHQVLLTTPARHAGSGTLALDDIPASQSRDVENRSTGNWVPIDRHVSHSSGSVDSRPSVATSRSQIPGPRPGLRSLTRIISPLKSSEDAKETKMRKAEAKRVKKAEQRARVERLAEELKERKPRQTLAQDRGSVHPDRSGGVGTLFKPRTTDLEA